MLLEEAIVNALIHRDYNFTGSNISINIYDDRIEIVNLGKLLEGLDESNFGKLSLRRNEILADIFARTPYVEKIGSGIKRIKKLCLENKNSIEFEFNSFFVLTIFKLSGNTNVPENRLEIILNLMSKNTKITISELSTQLNVNEKTIKRDLDKLKSKEKIKRVGPDKGGYWKVLK